MLSAFCAAAETAQPPNHKYAHLPAHMMNLQTYSAAECPSEQHAAKIS